MGVMGCHRKDCDHIMCDYYSSKYGYICWDCRNELVNALRRGVTIQEFMQTSKHATDVFSREVAEKIVEEEFETRSN